MWEQQKGNFRHEVQKIDQRRGEDFSPVFPELAGLMND